MSFASPFLLLGLLAVPLAAASFLVLERRRARRFRSFARDAMAPNVVRRSTRRRRLAPLVLFLAALSFLLIGLARPQRTLASNRGGAPPIVLTVDVSGSMAATDIQPDRIRAARALAIGFLNELPSTYPVALVSFGGTPRLLVAPTFNRADVIAALPGTVIHRSGTAIGDAVSYAVALIAGAAGQHAVGSVYRPGAVVLFSDGGQNAGGTTLQEAAVSALVDYVPVDTVAVGSSTGVVSQPLELSGLGNTTTLIHVPVQAAGLRALARQTGGSFFQGAAITASPRALAKVYTSLRWHVASRSTPDELSADAAGVALMLALAGVALSGLWFGRAA